MSNPINKLIAAKATILANQIAATLDNNLSTKAFTNPTSNYQAANTDVGRIISMPTGNLFLSTLVHNPGDAFEVFNNNATSSITITQNTGVTLYYANTSNSSGAPATGNRILSAKGRAMIGCVAANTYTISSGFGIF